jgi:hypothetical protein
VFVILHFLFLYKKLSSCHLKLISAMFDDLEQKLVTECLVDGCATWILYCACSGLLLCSLLVIVTWFLNLISIEDISGIPPNYNAYDKINLVSVRATLAAGHLWFPPPPPSP